jgi:hypothetical protein
LPTKYCSAHSYLFTGRAFPLLVCWSSDGDLTIFLLLFRQSDVVVQILPSAYSARPRPALRKSRERHNLCVGNTVDILAATYAVHRCCTQRLSPALPLLLCCLFLFFITPAQMRVSHVHWHSNFFCHPGSDCRTQPNVASIHFLQNWFLAFLPHIDWLLSSSASSVVPVFCVLACRHRFPPAKRRAGSSSIPTSLSRFTRGIPQHTVRLGQLSPMPNSAPTLASSCFPWPLSIAAFHLPKSPCRMRHGGTVPSCRGGQPCSQTSA